MSCLQKIPGDDHRTDIHAVSGMGMLNPDGKSYAFDSRGAGYGRGEGVATIVLKRLDEALQDGCVIHSSHRLGMVANMEL